MRGEKRFNSYIRWKAFHANSDKKQKIFFHTPVSKFQKISTFFNISTKQIYPKKKDSKGRYSTNFSRSRPEVYNKEGLLTYH